MKKIKPLGILCIPVCAFKIIGFINSRIVSPLKIFTTIVFCVLGSVSVGVGADLKNAYTAFYCHTIFNRITNHFYFGHFY